MAVLEYALIQYAKLVAKHWWRKSLSPYLCIHEFNELRGEIAGFQRAVGFYNALQLALRQPVAADGFERFRKCIKGIRTYCQTGGHGVTAEFINEGWRMFGDEIECIA